MTFAVVTRVPDPSKDDGNLAAAVVHRLPANMAYGVLIQGRVEVFCLGEILVLDLDGREVSGRGRKPAKWDVDIEEFDAIEGAVERAREVTNA